jgi:hypothetical protein
MDGIDELRHLSGIRIVVCLSDIEFMALMPSLAPRDDVEKNNLFRATLKAYLVTSSSFLTAHWIEQSQHSLELTSWKEKGLRKATVKRLQGLLSTRFMHAWNVGGLIDDSSPSTIFQQATLK